MFKYLGCIQCYGMQAVWMKSELQYVWAVSYTHLDVYKRQDDGSRWYCRNVWFCTKHWTTANEPGKEFEQQTTSLLWIT